MIEKIKSILHDIGYTQLQDSHDHWRCAALYRGGDNPTALCIEKNTGRWFDFPEQVGGSLVDLVRLTTDKKVDLDELFDSIRQEGETEEQFYASSALKMSKTWNIEEADTLTPHYQFYEDQGISKTTLSFFKSGMQHAGPLYGRYVFPILNKEGKINGWSGRDMTQRWKSNGIKWKHLGRKTEWVYPAYVGYDPAQNTSPCIKSIQEHNMAIIVESIGDMLMLWEAGVKNVLVSFGLDINSKTMALLVALDCEVCIATNNDFDKHPNRGLVAGIKNFLKCTGYFDIDKIHLYLPTENDFGCMSVDQIDAWVSNMITIRDPKYRARTYQIILDYLTNLYKTQKPNGKRAITKTQVEQGKLIRFNLENIDE